MPTFKTQKSLNEYADKLLQKYPGSEIIVEFAKVENGHLIDNEFFDRELCQDEKYCQDAEGDTESENDTEGDESVEEAEESDCEDSGNCSQFNEDSYFELIWKGREVSSYKDAIESWQCFCLFRMKYWYIYKGTQVMLVKPFNRALSNSLGKKFYPLWQSYFGGTDFLTSVKNCRAYSTTESGKTQWIILYSSIFQNEDIMGFAVEEPDWQAIATYNTMRKSRRSSIEACKVNLKK